MAHRFLRRSSLIAMFSLAIIGIVAAQSNWAGSIGYTIQPGASMAWLASMNLGNVDEGAVGSFTISNVLNVYLTKSGSYTVILSLSNVAQLQTHFATITITFKEGTSTMTTISLTNPTAQFTLNGPQTLVLNAVVAYTVQSSITSGQAIAGVINLTAGFA